MIKGIFARADHPRTVLNPDEYFEVIDIQVQHGKMYVRGKNTCWFTSTSINCWRTKQEIEEMNKENN